MTHPDDATLQTWHDGALAEGDARALTQHVAACAVCEAKLASLRALHDGLGRWADDAPFGDLDLSAAVLARIEATPPKPAEAPKPAPVVSLDAARARRGGGRMLVFPAIAAAAAFFIFVYLRPPASDVRQPDAPRPPVTTPGPGPAQNLLAQLVEVGGGVGGADVTRVDVQGAQSYSVLQIPGVSPGVTTAVVWIQDSPEEPSSPGSH